MGAVGITAKFDRRVWHKTLQEHLADKYDVESKRESMIENACAISVAMARSNAVLNITN
jgi:hypothetical protein